MSRPKSGELLIELTLSEEDWAEVYYAVEGKLGAVADGEYDDPKDPDNVRWVESLSRVLNKIRGQLDKHSVTY